MSDIVFRFISDVSGFNSGADSADATVQKLNKSVKQIEDTAKTSFDTATTVSKKTENAVEGINQKTISLKAQLRTLKAELANATDPKDVERLAKKAGELQDKISDAGDAAKVFASESKFEQVGNAVGSITSKLRNLDFKGALDQSKLLLSVTQSMTFKDATTGIKELGGTLLNVGKALLTNPLFILAGAIAAIVYVTYQAVTAFSKLGEQTETLNKSLNDSKKNIEELGKAQLDFMVRTSVANGQLTKEQGERVKIELKQSQQRKDIAKKYSEDVLALAKELELSLADSQKGRFSETYKGDINNLTARKRFNKEAAKLEKQLLIDTLVLTRSQAQEKIAINAEENAKSLEKQKEAQKKAHDDFIKNQEEFRQALLDLQKRSEQAEASGLSGEEKLSFQRQVNLKTIDELQKTLEKKQKAIGKGDQLELEQLQQLLNLRNQAESEYYAGVLKLAIDTANEQANASKREIDGELSNLELRNTIAKNNIEKTRAIEGASEREKLILENEKNKNLLLLDLKFQQDKLQLVLKDIDAEDKVKKSGLLVELQSLKDKDDAISKVRTKSINDELNQITTNTELLKQAAMASTDVIIAGINDGLSKSKPHKIDFAKLLGLDNQEIASALNVKFETNLNSDDIGKIKQAASGIASELQNITNSILEQENKRVDSEIENNQKLIDARQENIDNLQQQLEKEQALQDEGSANNVQSIQNALKLQQDAKQADLEKDKQLKEEKKKLAKQQLIIDTATQGASLITSAANIFATFSTIPIVGVPLAVAAIATMFAGFATAKAQAFNALEKQQFYKGGYVGDGGKYEEKGVVHGGEFVNTKETTSENRNLLEGLHKNDNRLIEIGIRDLIKNKGIDLESDIVKNINQTKGNIRDLESKNYFINHNKGVEIRIDELTAELKKLAKANNDSELIMPNGNRIIKKGSLTTIIRAKNG